MCHLNLLGFKSGHRNTNQQSLRVLNGAEIPPLQDPLAIDILIIMPNMSLVNAFATKQSCVPLQEDSYPVGNVISPR